VLATWPSGVVPSGLPLIGPDMSLEMNLFAFSFETAESDGSQLERPTWLLRGDGLGQYGRIIHPSLGRTDWPAPRGARIIYHAVDELLI
jgi:hypothetical protein